MHRPPVALVAQITEQLNRFDPAGLTPGTGGHSAPWNDYEHEARDFATLLEATGSVTADQVRTTWVKWFTCEPAAAGRDLSEDIAAALNGLVPAP